VAWELFEARAVASGAAVHHVADEPTAAALLPGAAACTATTTRRFPRVAARRAQAAITDGEPSLDVVATAAFAVAETGSVALVEATAQDRGACFLAERLWLLLPASELELSLDAALARLAALIRDGVPYVTLMTGPSRTADIERTLTIGVHGPRAVTIVVIGDAASPVGAPSA
jgi:L-lactate dehydrogenase complex protein LldG